MVSKQEINKCIENNTNFIVNGGAGSGKTYSLINTLQRIFENNKDSSVACITYTKVAVQEIRNRIDVSKYNLHVSTIHEFLWHNISNFQITIKNIIIEMFNKEDDGEFRINFSDDFDIDKFRNDIQIIQYRNYRRIIDGIISHDDVIKISCYMFKKYKKLCDITNDNYDFILVDEYQDSFKNVINIFIHELSKIDGKKSVIGFFGDPMQNIYNTGIGEINEDGFNIINKEDNWRSSQVIVNLINKFRNDNLIQLALGEYKDYSSKCTFVYSDKYFYEIKDKLKELKLIDFFDDYKELYLTHNLIGKLNGSEDLYNLFSNKDELIGENRCFFIKHLEKIESIRVSYINKKHNEILDLISLKIENLNDKKRVNKTLLNVFEDTNCSIGEIIDKCDENLIVVKDDIFNEEIATNSEIYNKLKEISYEQFDNCYSYVHKYTPFSTQHGVKGEEYNNVVVVLDNGNWNQYDYSSVLSGENTNSKYNRSMKIMYVSFSRAKKNLCVFYRNPTQSVLNGAKEIFGEENVIMI